VREKLNLHKVRLEIDDVLVPLHHGLEKARLTDKLRLLELIEAHAESMQLCYLQSVPCDCDTLWSVAQPLKHSIGSRRFDSTRVQPFLTNDRCHFERSGPRSTVTSHPQRTSPAAHACKCHSRSSVHSCVMPNARRACLVTTQPWMHTQSIGCACLIFAAPSRQGCWQQRSAALTSQRHFVGSGRDAE
jgi:hypothetical protein